MTKLTDEQKKYREKARQHGKAALANMRNIFSSSHGERYSRWAVYEATAAAHYAFLAHPELREEY